MRWLFDFLYGSVPAEFESRFELDESVRRLSSATRRFVFLVTRSVAVGNVSRDRVSLCRIAPFHGRFFVFFGEFHENKGRVVLSGRFTLNWFTKAFLTFWLGFSLFWTILAAVTVLARDLSLWWFPLFGVMAIGVGLMFVWYLKWTSLTDIAWLSKLMQDSLSR
jgi:hypothetical protein